MFHMIIKYNEKKKGEHKGLSDMMSKIITEWSTRKILAVLTKRKFISNTFE